jgi:hypothetical protein
MMHASLMVRRFCLLGSLSLLTLAGCTTPSATQSPSQPGTSNNLASSPTVQSASQPAAPPNLASPSSVKPESVPGAAKPKQSALNPSEPTQIAESNAKGMRLDAQATTSEPAEFQFFANPDLPQDPRVVRVLPHPCGAAAIARVTAMPKINSTGYLSPDKVVEIVPPSRDMRSLAESVTLRRWAKPIDSEVIALEGDRILVNVGQGKFYWIEPSGNFQLQPSAMDVPKPEAYATDLGKHPEFSNSGYARVWRFQDLNSGKQRVIIYEANCS